MSTRLNGFALIQTMSAMDTVTATLIEQARGRGGDVKMAIMVIAGVLRAQQQVLNELLERVAELQEAKP